MSGPRGSGQYLGEEGHGGHGHNGRRESDRDGEHAMDTLGLGRIFETFELVNCIVFCM